MTTTLKILFLTVLLSSFLFLQDWDQIEENIIDDRTDEELKDDEALARADENWKER